MRGKVITAGALVVWQCWAVPAFAQTSAAAVSDVESRDRSDAGRQSKEEAPPGEKQADVLLRTNVPLGGYGGPDVRMGALLGEPAMLVGAQASWLANHQYLFGVAGYGLATRHDAPETMRIDGNRSTLGLVYGGLRLGFVAMPHRLLHVTLATLAGPGSLTGISSVPTRAEFEVGYERRTGHAETFFVLEPEIAAEANVTSFMRVALGATYRYVTGVQQPGLSNASLSSPTASLAFKFGVF